MKGVIVSKYGGSSITNYNDVKRIERITEDNSYRKIIVVSAPGKRDKEDKKVTDLLIELAKDKYPSLEQIIIERYQLLYPKGNMDNIYSLLKQRESQSTPEYDDPLKSFGEEACAKIVGEVLNAEFVDPNDLFLVSENYGNIEILPESETMIRKRLGEKDNIYVIPGFYGYTEEGNIKTFKRGGSDLTGAYIAAALDAELYENFTDKEGIFAANPDTIKDPKKIDLITFSEIRDLSYSGFNILHERAIEPVKRKRIPIHVRKTFTYPSKGTYIVYDRINDPKKPVVGVAYKEGLHSIDIDKLGLNDMMGIGANILKVFEEEKISVEFITTGIDDMSIIFRENQLSDSPNILGDIANKVYSLIGEDASINFQGGMGSLVISGKGMKGKKGLSADIQLTLAKAGINIKFISQGPKERCIIYGIDDLDRKKAVEAIYEKYLK